MAVGAESRECGFRVYDSQFALTSFRPQPAIVESVEFKIYLMPGLHHPAHRLLSVAIAYRSSSNVAAG